MNHNKKLSQGRLAQGRLGQGRLGQGRLGQGRLGFSLLELSFVLVITAVLIAVIAKGGQILGKSRAVSAQSITKSSPIPHISNLLIWYETTMENSFNEADLASGNINTWININPTVKTNNALAGVAPTYTKNAMNGLPALRFNGSTQFLTFDGTGIVNSDYTIVVVEQRRSSQPANYFIGGINGDFSIGYSETTTVIFDTNDGNIQLFTVPAYSSPIPKINIFRFSSITSITDNRDYYLNGTLMPWYSFGTPILNAVTDVYDGAQIGRNWDVFYYNGDIGEIIIFNKYLNDDERKSVEKYLSQKWSITIS